MRRRDALLGLAAFGAAPFASFAQQPGKVRRIGLLIPNTAQGLVDPFRKRLASLGWVEGQAFVIESRQADNRNERLPALAAELVALKVDVIVTVSTPGALAAKAATSTIPVVFAHVADPVRTGVVASLGRPGGNVTGISNLAGQIVVKQLELLKALLPRLERVAYMSDPSIPGQGMADSLKAAAGKIGLTIVSLEARTAGEIEQAFARAARERATAMIVPPAPLYFAQNKLIIELARKNRIATAHQNRAAVVDGGLVSYGVDFIEGFARTAVYVDKILKGAKPGDLPVEQADRFVTVVNQQTAAALGISIPQSVLVRADEVIR